MALLELFATPAWAWVVSLNSGRIGFGQVDEHVLMVFDHRIQILSPLQFEAVDPQREQIQEGEVCAEESPVDRDRRLTFYAACVTDQYKGSYCVRVLDEGEAMTSQDDPAEILDFRAEEAQLSAEGPSMIRATTLSRVEAEQIVDSPSINHERERLILDLDPVSANLPGPLRTP